MKGIKSIALALIALLFFTSVAVADHTLPTGDYLKSCLNCRIMDDKLSCWCYDNDASPNLTIFKGARSCSNITNNNGELECFASKKPLPDGSYQKSCQDCEYDGRNLNCECLTTDQVSFAATTLLKASHCATDIANQAGNLRCVDPNNLVTELPVGSYMSSCKQCRILKGWVLECRCDDFKSKFLIQSRIFYPNRCLDIENIGGKLSCIRQ